MYVFDEIWAARWSGAFVDFAALHHKLDIFHGLDVLAWITSHADNVGKETWRNASTVFDFQQLRRSNRRALNRLHRCHAPCDKRLKFAPWIVVLQGPVGREGDFHPCP